MATPTNLPAAQTTGNVLTAAYVNDLRGAFRILQVLSTTKTDTFTMSSTTFADVTGLSVSITPQSTSSKIFIMATVSGTGQLAATNFFGRLMRDSTPISVGDAASSRIQATIAARDQDNVSTMPIMFLDSPSTTSALSYKIQVRSQGAGSVIYINRSGPDADSATTARTVSSITVFEVSA
jgi:hypothetical protein